MPANLNRYYSFTDVEKVVFIGEFESIDAAMEAEPGNSVWIFDEPGIFDLRDQIDEAINQGR